MNPFKRFALPTRPGRPASLVAAATFFLASAAALFFLIPGAAQPLPGPLQALQRQGVTIAEAMWREPGSRSPRACLGRSAAQASNRWHPFPPMSPGSSRKMRALMSRLGLQATPAVVWRNPGGVVQKRTGVPAQAMAEVFGPHRP